MQRQLELKYALRLETSPSAEFVAEISGSAVLVPQPFSTPGRGGDHPDTLKRALEDWQLSNLALELYRRNYEVLHLLLAGSLGSLVPPPSLIEDVHLMPHTGQAGRG